MPDITDVPGASNAPRGPSLDDVLDTLARTNRGVLALAEQVKVIQSLILFAIVFLASLLFGLKTRIISLGA